jgi:hypothetical protein
VLEAAEKAQEILNAGTTIFASGLDPAPLKELFGYSSAIRSLSQGRAGCSMEPYGYQVAPQEDLDSFAMG